MYVETSKDTYPRFTPAVSTPMPGHAYTLAQVVAAVLLKQAAKELIPPQLELPHNRHEARAMVADMRRADRKILDWHYRQVDRHRRPTAHQMPRPQHQPVKKSALMRAKEAHSRLIRYSIPATNIVGVGMDGGRMVALSDIRKGSPVYVSAATTL